MDTKTIVDLKKAYGEWSSPSVAKRVDEAEYIRGILLCLQYSKTVKLPKIFKSNN